MSELFNQGLSVSGKIPTGHFNSAFEFTGIWQRDAAETKALAFERVSIELYNIALDKSILVLRDHVKQAVPTSWDPAALARWVVDFLSLSLLASCTNIVLRCINLYGFCVIKDIIGRK